MNTISRSALVGYDAGRMYALVEDIEAYPQFLPWCASARIVERSDEVVTAGGILGKVTETSDNFLTVEIANSVQVKVQRHTVTSVLPKGTLKSA